MQDNVEQSATTLHQDTSDDAKSITWASLNESEQRYLVQRENGEVFMNPSTIFATDVDSEQVLLAFDKALQINKSLNGCQNVTSDDCDRGQYIVSEKWEEDTVARAETFSSLFQSTDSAPAPKVTTFSWDESRAKAALDEFNETIQKERQKRHEEESAQAQKAIAVAEAASLASDTRQRPKSSKLKKRQSFNADPVVWAAQEDATASSVLRELRAGLLRLKKGSSRAPAEGSPIWSLVSQKSAKLKPEAAAEMARARIAAAAAAAVMRDDESTRQPKDSMGDLGASDEAGQKQTDGMIGQFGTRLGLFETSQRPDLSHFRHELFPLSAPHNMGFLPALPTDKAARLKVPQKKKKVEFAPGTVFCKLK